LNSIKKYLYREIPCIRLKKYITNSVKIDPPLVITKSEIKDFLDVFGEVLAEI